MSLKATLSNAVVTAMTALGDIPKTISYYSKVAGAYDAASDTFSNTDVLITCKGLVYKSKVENMEWKRTELTETKVLIAGKVFEDAGVTPKDEDYMVIGGVKYEIMVTRPAPSEPAYIFTVKAV